MKFIVLLISMSGLILCFACKEHKKNDTIAPALTTDTANYFPLNAFFEEQSRYVDLRNLRIIRTVTQNGIPKKDTISTAVFFTELSAFKALAIEFNTQKKYYKETVFQDLGTESYTINYQPTNPNLHIQRIDILLRAETNTVKQFFARSFHQKNDTSLTRQFSFSTDKKMEISTEYSIHNSKPIREIRLIEWFKE